MVGDTYRHALYSFMSCYHVRSIFIRNKKGAKQLVDVPCGHCIGCYEQYSNEWVTRCMVELRMHQAASFITLTYSDECLPPGGNLRRSDVQNFLKRFRKTVGKVRYFGCGEYGSEKDRCHFHLILFGWYPDDAKYFFTKDGIKYYRSATLEKLWTNGFSLVTDVTPKSCKYCTKYMQKFLQTEKDHSVKPFTMMSLKPSIGFDGMTQKEIDNDCLYVNGHPHRLPRSYVRRFENLGFDVSDIREKRSQYSRYMSMLYQYYDIDIVAESKKAEKTFLEGLYKSATVCYNKLY